MTLQPVEMTIETINYPTIAVPEGPFLMGTIPTELRKTDHEEPQREVNLDAYYIGKYLVTNAQYAQFVETTGCVPPRFHTDPRFNSPNFPVVGVTWHDAQAFLEWLNDLAGEWYRLLTEAEWEKAARGADGREYPWGNEWDASKANSSESRLKQLTPVGSYPDGVSPYGCYDMAGNTYEWCADWFHPQTYQYSPTRNPQGPVDGRRKVIRGGSWIAQGKFATRCANRAACEPIESLHNLGIRIAR